MLVVDSQQFEVIDKSSGENITRSILLHVIAEQEETSQSVMSEGFLESVIRAYTDNDSEGVRSCLENALKSFLNNQPKGADSGN